MRLPAATLSLALVLALSAAAGAGAATPPGDVSGDGLVSVADGVRMLRAASGLSSDCTLATCDVDASGAITITDAVQTLRAAADLGATVPRGIPPTPPPSTSVDVHFTFGATAAIDGYRVDVSYPLAKGGFAGSADAVACTSSGGGIFIVNDQDDGRMIMVGADFTGFTFPFEVTCRFEQTLGQTLTAADIGVTVVEVSENGGQPGDPEDLHVVVTIGDQFVPVCNDGFAALGTSAGGVLDLGWTGVGHGSTLPSGVRATLPLTCTPGNPSCTLDGAPLAGQPAGPPLSVSAGGVSMCLVNAFTATAPTGTFDCETGCTELQATLDSSVYLVVNTDRPCPPCVGDLVANDGSKDGTCLEGATPGAACDAEGVNERFAGAGPDFGTTSSDCLPAGASVGELTVELDPLTTGATSLTASVDCLSEGFPAGSCHCPGQIQPNSCLDGVCSPSGLCESGPVDGICSQQAFHNCEPGTATRDCEDVFPGSGTCVEDLRRCFGSTIAREGTCGERDATLTAVFCLGFTRAAAINSTYGLPGPAAVAIPVRYGPAPASTVAPTPTFTPSVEPTPGASGCSELPRAGCVGAGARQSTLHIQRQGTVSNDLGWRWLGGSATTPFDFGRPDLDTGYALCIYASPAPQPTAAPSPLLFAADAPAAAVCKGKPCWKATHAGGFVYRDPQGRADGLTRLELVPGAEGKSRIVVKAHGPNLPLPAMPLPGAPIVQLQAANGSCWTQGFAPEDVTRNDRDQFRAVRR